MFNRGRRGRWRSGILEFFLQQRREAAGDQYRDGDVESADESVAYRERKEAAILPGDLDCRGIPGGESCKLEVHRSFGNSLPKFWLRTTRSRRGRLRRSGVQVKTKPCQGEVLG
jgi:hypothetical protein